MNHFVSSSNDKKMADVALLDLLECPLCMDPLDTSAKVLPCQHTFCKPCLLGQEASLPQMCCPECRAPLLGTVEDLPTNLLLARLLEGLGRDHLGKPKYRSSVYGSNRAQSLDSVLTRLSEDVLPPLHEQSPGPPGVLAKALVNYQGNGPGELTMNSGDIVSLQYRVDENWYYGDTKGNNGLVPAKMVQTLSEQTQPVALCRALYDFDLNRLDPADRRECLGFLKGEIVTVIRRVDENWVEGKLRDKVGIFPLLFTEPNPAARRLLARGKVSECAEPRPRDPRNSRDTAGRIVVDAGGRRRYSGTRLGTARPPDVSLLNSLNRASLRHIQSPPPLHAGPVAPPAPGKAVRLATTSRQRSSSTGRSVSKVERSMNSEFSPSITMALISPPALPPPTESKQFPTQQLSVNVCAVLYSYIPHRPEELELRKGEMVGVYGKFKEGWLRGLSLRNGKVGILPANYVMPVLRTSARFLEQPKPIVPIASTLSTKRYAPQKPQAGVLALDKVRTDGTPAAPLPSQPVVSSGGSLRILAPGSRQGWDTVRHTVLPARRVSPQRSSYHTQNPAPSLQSPAQDLGQMCGTGHSPVLPRKRNGLFSNPIRPQHWTYEGTTPSGGSYQAMDAKYSVPKETSTAPHSILVKPDSYKHNPEKPAKSVRFSTEELPQTTARVSSSTGIQIKGNSQSSPTALEYWNPSAILGRDGSTSVLKDTKALLQRKGQNQAAIESPPLNIKTSTVSSLPSPSRYRVGMGYKAQNDSELNLLEGEMVLIQKPRADGRILLTREITGKTGLFHSSILEVLDKGV
ncbi:E3 ubiquitin-protein ligase SH3RF2 isoform X2 [Brachyhypopomus gauderio]